MELNRTVPFILVTVVLLILFVNDLKGLQVFALDDLEKPSILKIGKNNIYIVDGYMIKVFSKNKKKLLHILGKKGEGPGEFTHRPDSIQLLKDEILCSSPYKLMYFTYQGAFIKEFKTKKAIRQLQELDNNSFTGIQLVEGENSISDLILNIYDDKFNIKNTLYKRIYESKNARIDLFVRFTRPPYHMETGGGKIIFADIARDFKVNINDLDGKLIYQIKRKHQPIEFTKADQNKVIKYWESMSRSKNFIGLFKISVSFPEYFPPICTWKMVKNKVYLITFNRFENKNECLIYDLKGNFLKKTFVPLKSPGEILYTWYPFDIHKDRFYQLNDNYEDETWELIISDIK